MYNEHDRVGLKHEHDRGTIKHNALAALVTSPLYRSKVERSKKGKGSYNRKAKFKNNSGSWGSAVKRLVSGFFSAGLFLPAFSRN